MLKGFGSASKDRQINASITSMCIIGGVDCGEGLTPDLKVLGGTQIKKKLCVTGNTQLANLALKDDLLVCGNSHMKENLIVDGSILSEDLGVLSDILICGNGRVKGDFLIDGDLEVLGNIIGNGGGGGIPANLVVDTLTSDIVTANSLIVNDNITVNGDGQIMGDLEVCGNITGKMNILLNGDINIDGSGTIEGDINGNGDLCIEGDGKFTGDLYVGGNVMAPFVNIQGNCILSNDTDAMVCVYDGGAVDINSTNLNINGPTNINNDTTITGTTTINGQTIINNEMTINGNLNVSGKISSDDLCANTLQVFNDINFGGNIIGNHVNGNSLNIVSDSVLCGNVLIKGNLDILGEVNTNTLNVIDDSILCGNVLIKGNLTVQETLKTDIIEPDTNANVAVNSDLIVNGDISADNLGFTVRDEGTLINTSFSTREINFVGAGASTVSTGPNSVQVTILDSPVVMDENASGVDYPTDPSADGLWYGTNSKAQTNASSVILGNFVDNTGTLNVVVGSQTHSRGSQNVIIGYDAQGGDVVGGFSNGVMIGENIFSRGTNHVIIGADANAGTNGSQNIVLIGQNSSASGSGSVTIGTDALNGGGTNGVAIGRSATLGGGGRNIAIGYNSFGGGGNNGGNDNCVVGANARLGNNCWRNTVIGAGSNIPGGGGGSENFNNTLIGYNIDVNTANKDFNVAVGTNISVTQNYTVAVGDGSGATASGAVALGQGIIANQTNGFFVKHRAVDTAVNIAGFRPGTNELIETTNNITIGELDVTGNLSVDMDSVLCGDVLIKGNLDILGQFELENVNANVVNANVINTDGLLVDGNVDINGTLDMFCKNISNVQAIFVDQMFGKNSPINVEDTLIIQDNGGDSAQIRFASGIEIGDASTTAAGGSTAIAIGKSSSANSVNSIAIGQTARANANYAITIGNGNNTSQSTINIGNNIDGRFSTESVVIGHNADGFNCSRSVCIGAFAATNGGGGGATAIGFGAYASQYSVAVGRDSSASSTGAAAVGRGAIAVTRSTAMGSNDSVQSKFCRATADLSSAFGCGAQSLQTGSTAIGFASGANNNVVNATHLGSGAQAIDVSHSLAFGVNGSSINPGSLGISVCGTVSLGGTSPSSAPFQLPLYSSLYEETVTSGGTKVLTVTSAQKHMFTGTMNHTVQMPSTLTLSNGFMFTLVNSGTGTITVNNSPATTVNGTQSLTVAPFTLNVASTGSFPSSGSLTIVTTSFSPQIVTYTSKTSTSFLNCVAGGSYTTNNGSSVTSSAQLITTIKPTQTCDITCTEISGATETFGWYYSIPLVPGERLHVINAFGGTGGTYAVNTVISMNPGLQTSNGISFSAGTATILTSGTYMIYWNFVINSGAWRLKLGGLTGTTIATSPTSGSGSGGSMVYDLSAGTTVEFYAWMTTLVFTVTGEPSSFWGMYRLY